MPPSRHSVIVAYANSQHHGDRHETAPKQHVKIVELMWDTPDPCLHVRSCCQLVAAEAASLSFRDMGPGRYIAHFPKDGLILIHSI